MFLMYLLPILNFNSLFTDFCIICDKHMTCYFLNSFAKLLLFYLEFVTIIFIFFKFKPKLSIFSYINFFFY